MSDLIIVESPAKARTIGGFLGKEYKVVASKGHIRDLPTSKFGIEIDEKGNFIPQYTISKDASQIVKELKSLAKDASNIYIATDEDREGEAIGFHIATAIGKDPNKLPRIVFHEITKNAINHALANPRTIDMHSVNAQQARRLLDRIVGYKLSPLLASKIQKGLSAGRVQSSTLKLIVEREREIKSFESIEYWSIEGVFEKEVEANLIEFQNNKIEKLTIKNENEAKEIENIAKSDKFIIGEIEKNSKKTKTPPPFMTSTLQQSAASRLGFSPKKTMMIAQKLYEGVKTDRGTAGLITYMRTDSLNLSKESVVNAREYIDKKYGSAYLPAKPKIYTTKSKGAQEAHEAIRPTMMDFEPLAASKYLSSDELKLYKLIFDRFVASQMNEAIIESQSIIFQGKNTAFKANGKKLLFDGFYKAVGYSEKDKLLPELVSGKEVLLDAITSTQHFTEPPPRYNEASLIKTLESLGIGRPSTYAPTITILDTRKYIEIKEKKIYPTDIAMTVTEILEGHFAEIVDSSFTANMEEKLDLIAENEQDWQNILKEFYVPFMAKIESGKNEIKSLKVAKPTGESCPQCGSELLLRSGKFGEFIACSNFPKCKYTKNINEDSETKTQTDEKTTDEICDKCGAAMVVKNGRNGEFLACSAYPKCKNAKPLTPPKELSVPCPKCGGKIHEKSGKKGIFYGCSNYPRCKFISNIELTSTKCEKCGSIMGHKKLKTKDELICLQCKHKAQI